MAFQAYRLLHYYGISPENLAIVGEGYSSPERVGLRSPLQIALGKARSFGSMAAICGTILSLMVFLFLQLGLALTIPLTGFLCGVCGAALGALFGLLGEGNTASIYRHHLNQGRYLLLIEGSEKLVRLGQDVLSQYSASNL
jgi:hypothetical protein